MRLTPFAAALCFSLSLAAAFPAGARPHRTAHHGAAPAAAAGAVVSAAITHSDAGLVFNISIRNASPVPLCALPTYGGGARVTATRRGRTLRNLQINAMPPQARAEAQASCLRLDPNATTRVTYRLDRMYSGPLGGARVCYSFPWRRIDQRQARQNTDCAIAP